MIDNRKSGLSRKVTALTFFVVGWEGTERDESRYKKTGRGGEWTREGVRRQEEVGIGWSL